MEEEIDIPKWVDNLTPEEAYTAGWNAGYVYLKLKKQKEVK